MVEAADFLAGGRVPQPDHPVPPRGGQHLAVRGKRQGGDRAAVSKALRPQAGERAGGQRIAARVRLCRLRIAGLCLTYYRGRTAFGETNQLRENEENS